MLISIAVDGPAGSGKSTVAKEVAKKLNITYLDTGAMYRMVTLNLIKEKIKFDDLVGIKNILDHIQIEFRPTGLFLNDENVTTEIRNNIVTNAVSKVAAIGIVREKMVAMQQSISKGQSIIMDGRDIGTHVLKNANFKFFLVATVEERAKRRWLEFKNQGIEMSFEALVEDIKSRDEQDMSREITPLRQADDAILIDTTTLNVDEVIDFIIKEIQA